MSRYLFCQTIDGDWWYRDMLTGENLPKFTQPIYDISECHVDIGEGESKTALSRKIEMKELEELMQYKHKSRKRHLKNV